MSEPPKINLKISQDELQILHQALNEVCHGLDIPEFHPRMGATKFEVLELMEKLRLHFKE